jgi:hypothetical protein
MRRESAMKGTTKKRVEGSLVGITDRVNLTDAHIRPLLECLDPNVGEKQVIAYIAGGLREREHEDFLIHVSQCRYCLREVVAWRAAQVLAEIEMETKARSAKTIQLSIASPVTQLKIGLANRGRQSDRLKLHLILPELSAFSKMHW